MATIRLALGPGQADPFAGLDRVKKGRLVRHFQARAAELKRQRDANDVKLEDISESEEEKEESSVSLEDEEAKVAHVPEPAPRAINDNRNLIDDNLAFDRPASILLSEGEFIGP